MGTIANLKNEKFGRLTVKNTISKNGRGYSYCECACGNMLLVRNDALKSGKTVSCGCFNRDRAKRGDNRRTHGKWGTRLYRIWQAVKTRTNNPHFKQYGDYGGRGIMMCEEWLNSFESFYEWAVANGYNEKMSIERKDVNKGYSPDNCEWIPLKDQSGNKRNTVKIEFNGDTHTIKEWAEITGLSKSSISWRYYRKWDAKKILTTPTRKKEIIS